VGLRSCRHALLLQVIYMTKAAAAAVTAAAACGSGMQIITPLPAFCERRILHL
jgi:hypothetical protein